MKGKLIEEKPQESDKPTYQDLLNEFLISEGIKPKEPEPVIPRPTVDELSPRPHRTSYQFQNNKCLNKQGVARVLAKYFQVDSIEHYNIFKPKNQPKVEEEEEGEKEDEEDEDYENDEDRKGFESEIEEESEDDLLSNGEKPDTKKKKKPNAR